MLRLRFVLSVIALRLALASGAAPASDGAKSDLEMATANASWAREPTLARLALAKAAGDHSVIVMVAARAQGECWVELRGLLASLGGEIQYEAPELGYLRASVPTSSFSQLAQSRAIEAIQICERRVHLPASNSTPNPRRLLTASASETADKGTTGDWPPNWSDYPMTHPYSVRTDIDADQFLRTHPTFDGRGVTIAHLESAGDFLLPEFQTAYAIDGTRIRKTADVVAVGDPTLDSDRDKTFIGIQKRIRAENGMAEIDGRMFRVPHDGPYRFGVFEYSNAVSSEVRDVIEEKFGSPGLDGGLAVLVDEDSGEAFVDANNNLDFRDEKSLQEYSRRGDIGIFGNERPSGNAIGFTVSFFSAGPFVKLNIGSGKHATHVMGAAVANPAGGSNLTGIAPGARIVWYVLSDLCRREILEAAIAAMRNPQVDLVSCSIGGEFAETDEMSADGHDPFNIILERLQRRYQKLFFAAAGNGGGLAVPLESGLAPLAMSIGAYQSQESYRVNNGFVPEGYDHLHSGGRAHGPDGKGGMKPDLLAPSGSLSLWPHFIPEAKYEGLWRLPRGYGIALGTSAAAPAAAACAALVISGAKQKGLELDVVQLKAALLGGARFIERIKAHQQGAGLIQVGKAFATLEKLQGESLEVIESRAPVVTRTGAHLVNPGIGVGIYEREGWDEHSSGERTITLARHSGPPGIVEYKLKWEGDTAAFQSVDRIGLPLDVPVCLAVQVQLGDMGAYSALLTLERENQPVPALRVLNTIIGAPRISADGEYSARLAVSRPDDAEVFVRVPKEAKVVCYETVIEGIAPAGFSAEVFSPGRKKFVPPVREIGGNERILVNNPQDGVWDIDIGWYQSLVAGRWYDPTWPKPFPPNPVGVRAKAYGANVEPATNRVAIPALCQDATVMVKMTNQFGAIRAGAVSAPLASMAEESVSIMGEEMLVRDIQVPVGTSELRVGVSDVQDSNVGVNVFDCTGKDPVARGRVIKSGSSTEVAVVRPSAGLWRVVLFGSTIPGKTSHCRIWNYFSNARFGGSISMDLIAPRAPRMAWSCSLRICPAELPEGSRRLVAPVIVAAEAEGKEAASVEIGRSIIRVDYPVSR